MGSQSRRAWHPSNLGESCGRRRKENYSIDTGPFIPPPSLSSVMLACFFFSFSFFPLYGSSAVHRTVTFVTASIRQDKRKHRDRRKRFLLKLFFHFLALSITRNFLEGNVVVAKFPSSVSIESRHLCILCSIEPWLLRISYCSDVIFQHMSYDLVFALFLY